MKSEFEIVFKLSSLTDMAKLHIQKNNIYHQNAAPKYKN